MVQAIITRITIAIAVLIYGPDFGCSNSPSEVAVAAFSTSPQLARDMCPFLLPIQLASVSLASSIIPVASRAVGGVADSSTLAPRGDLCPLLWPIQRTPIVASITTLNDLAAALGQSGPAAWKADRAKDDDRVVRVVDEHYSIQSHARFRLWLHLPRSSCWLQTSTIIFLVALTIQSLVICWLVYHGRRKDASNDGIITGLRNELTKKSKEYRDVLISKCEALQKITEELEWSELAYNTDRAAMRNIINWHKGETIKLQGTVEYLINLMEILQHALNAQMGINTGLVDEKKKAEKAHQATFDAMFEAQLEIQALQGEINQLEDGLEELREREAECTNMEAGQYEEDRTPRKYIPQVSSSGTAGLFTASSDSESPAMTSDSSDCDSDSDMSVFSSPIQSSTSGTKTSWLKTRPEWAEASIKVRGGKRRPRLPSQMMGSTSVV